MELACPGCVGVKRAEDLIALQLAREFKRLVYRLVASSPDAKSDFRFRSQLFDAVASTEANIVEGFHRRTAAQFDQFLSYARGSHAEAMTRLQDGIDRGYFRAKDCEAALMLGKRCGMAILRLSQSLEPFIRRNK